MTKNIMKAETEVKGSYQISSVIQCLFTIVFIATTILWIGWKLRDTQVKADIENARTEGYLTALKDVQNDSTQQHIQSNKQKHNSSATAKVSNSKTICRQ